MAHRPRRRWHHDRSPNSSHLPPPRSCHAVTHSVLETRQLTKTYTSGDRPLTVLDNVSIAIEAGSTSAIVGPSGSGKTTLLGLCAGLDRATSGSVILDGVSLDGLDEDARARLRNERVGFVFQTFQLVPTLSAIENVGVPLELRGRGVAETLSDAAFAHARAEGLRIQPSCSYLRARYLPQHEEACALAVTHVDVTTPGLEITVGWGGVATLTLSDARRRNPLTRGILLGMRSFLVACAGMAAEPPPPVRAIVIESSGPVWSSGHDFKDFS
ncbi:MAG: ATP-binding cassette domain-containing protein [Gemmatimonadetes bacterium]|nr:ATP-binding cassette domain-containing protein [Gemmatimonadota bacterium]